MYTVDGNGDASLTELCGTLRSLRVAQGKSQADLGEAAGVTRNHYQLLESGKGASGAPANPRLSTLRGLAAALGVSVVGLLTQPRPYDISARAALPSRTTPGDDPVAQVHAQLTLLLRSMWEKEPRLEVASAGRGSVSIKAAIEAPDTAIAEALASLIFAALEAGEHLGSPERIKVRPSEHRVGP